MATPIKFGTDGWRAEIGFDFNEHNLRRLMHSVGRRINDMVDGRAHVCVGYDTRFKARDFSSVAVECLISEGCHVLFSQSFCPTPSLSFSVRELEADLGVQLTASHNPYTYLGVKLKGPNGGPLPSGIISQIESEIESEVFDKADKRLRPHVPADFNQLYREGVEGLVDFGLLKKSKRNIFVDFMHGAQMDLFKNIFINPGNMSISYIRDSRDSTFGNVTPEPIPSNLKILSDSILSSGKKSIGISFDGDGDRFALCDERGEVLWPQETFAIIADIIMKESKGNIAKSLPTSLWLNKIAEKYKVDLFETPVGFKYLSDYLDSGNALIAGEESGGVGFSFHIPERDGLLASLKIIEHLIKEKKTLRTLRKNLRKVYGDFHYEREDLKVDEEVAGLIRKEPKKYIDAFSKKFGISKKKIIVDDGIKLNLENDSWVMVRGSGTEPILRVYCESPESKNIPLLLKEFKSVLFE
tara:strand:+ start:716 stop:2122 length:1407 start_codon:yes stop_codon:yes gene_type:complete